MKKNWPFLYQIVSLASDFEQNSNKSKLFLCEKG